MAGITKLAWRNLGRNRRRTLITASALALGTALCVATYGLTDGMFEQMVTALTRFELGHLQAHQTEYLDRRTLDLTLPKAAVVDRALRLDPAVKATSPRVFGFALASKGSKSRAAQLVGVDPRREPRVTDLHRRITAGHFVADKPTPWRAGRRLTAKERAKDRALTQRAEKKVFDELDGLEDLSPSPTTTPTVEGPKPPTLASGRRGPTRPSTNLRALSRGLARTLDPPPKRPPDVVLGKRLAKILHAKVGDLVYLVGQTVDGASTDVQVRVRGILQTGTETYDRRVYLHIADLQRFIRLRHRVHEIAVLLKEDQVARAPEVAAKLRKMVPQGAVVQSWGEIRPAMRSMIDASRGGMVLMALIIMLIAVIGVVNTMLMSVFERTRELGVLKAIGMSGGRILRLIVIETVILAVLAAVVGTLLGAGIDLYLLHYGIDLTGATSTSFGGVALDPVLRAAFTVEGLVSPALILILSCLVASLYPGLRAARLRPAIGMREV